MARCNLKLRIHLQNPYKLQLGASHDEGVIRNNMKNINLKAKSKKCCVYFKYIDKPNTYTHQEILENTRSRIEECIKEAYEKGYRDSIKVVRVMINNPLLPVAPSLNN